MEIVLPSALSRGANLSRYLFNTTSYESRMSLKIVPLSKPLFQSYLVESALL